MAVKKIESIKMRHNRIAENKTFQKVATYEVGKDLSADTAAILVEAGHAAVVAAPAVEKGEK